MKAKKKGRSIITCHHPMYAEIYCELLIDWRIVDDKFEILNSKILTYCEQRAHDDEPIPEWVNYELLETDILEYELD